MKDLALILSQFKVTRIFGLIDYTLSPILDNVFLLKLSKPFVSL